MAKTWKAFVPMTEAQIRNAIIAMTEANIRKGMEPEVAAVIAGSDFRKRRERERQAAIEGIKRELGVKP
jgi:hypothetical protein